MSQHQPLEPEAALDEHKSPPAAVAPTLFMTVVEANGERNVSDITEYATPLFLSGSPVPPVAGDNDVPFIELQLNGVWDWGSGISDEEALVRIANAIHSAVMETLAAQG